MHALLEEVTHCCKMAGGLIIAANPPARAKRLPKEESNPINAPRVRECLCGWVHLWVRAFMSEREERWKSEETDGEERTEREQIRQHSIFELPKMLAS